jgi:hypothetical protein
VVDTKIIIPQKWRAKGEERHKGSLIKQNLSQVGLGKVRNDFFE